MSEKRWPGGAPPPASSDPGDPDSDPGRAGSSPGELPLPPPDHVPAGAIMLDSNRELLRRMRKRLASTIGPLLGLWFALCVMYFVTAGPISILMLGISVAFDPESASMYLAYMGFRPAGLIALFTIVPLIGTALSLVCLPLSARFVGRIRPDRFLTERAFQDAVSFRAALPLLLPAAAACLLALLLVLPGTPTVHWHALSPGAIGSFCGAGLLLLITHRALARRLTAWRILEIDSAEVIAHRMSSAGTSAERRRAAVFRAEDIRPNPPVEPFPPGLRQRAVLTLTRRLCGAPLITGAVSMVVLGWSTDIVRGFSQLGALATGGFGAVVAPAGSTWPTLGLLAAGYALVAGAVAVAAPGQVQGASRHGHALARSRRDARERQRSYGAPIGTPAHPLLDTHLPEIEAASRFLDRRGGIFDLVALAVQLIIAVVGYLIQADAFLVLQTIVLGGVFLVARREIREDVGGELLDVAYGPAWRFVRRAMPYQLVAPARGTREQLAARQEQLGIVTAVSAPGSAPPGADVGVLPDFGRADSGRREWRPGPADPTEIPPRL